MKRKKSFDWYGAKQRFSIRTYHFGAASVLLGLTLATGAQAVQAEELVADTTVTTSIQSPATTDTTPALTMETVAPAERTATIDYVVNYVLEDGTLVNAVVKTATVTTTEVVASTSVEVAVEVPAGYELAQGQATTVTQVVTEGAENLVTVQLVKKAEVAAPTTEVATAAPATTTEAATAAPATTTEVATETPADATEVAAPVTAEEAKVVLEQNISEAQLLSNEASRLYATTQAGNEALKTAADATQLVATDATAVLNDSLATLEQVNAQIDAVRTNVEALAVEFRKFSTDGEISVALFEVAGTTAGLNNIGDGVGTLIKTDTTVSAPMTDAAGAAVSSRVQSPYAPTAVDGYYTMTYMTVSYYDAIMGYSRYKPTGGTSTGGAYFRTSIKSANVADPILVELVAKDGTLLESHYMTPNVSKDFTYFQATSGVNKPMTATIRTDVASDTVLGQIFIQFDDNTIATASDTRSLPSTLISQPWEYTTYYKTTADSTNEALATYTIVGVPGNTVTPSGVREFGGYEYVNTTTENIQVNQVAGAPYVERTRAHVNGTYHKSVATPMGTDGSIKLDLYFADPNYAGTPNFEDTSSEGFIKIIETQTMGYTQSNTTQILSPELFDKYPIYFIDASTEAPVGTEKGPVPVKGTRLTSADQMDLSKLTSTAQYYQITFKENAAAGELSFARIGVGTVGSTRQIRIEYNVKGDGTETNDQADGQDRVTTYKGTFIPITLQNQPNIITETTHWYRPVIQEAIIRYQVEGATDFLEDSGTLTGNPGTDITYSTEATINKYKKLGYELVSDNFTTDAGQDYDYDTAVKQEFLVVIKPRIEEVPKTAVPGEPVDPTDPNSPKWPATVENLETTQEVTRTVEYKYEDGTPVRVDAAGNVLPKDSTEGKPLVKTETVTFTRPAQVNLVTGEVTYGEWVADTTDTLSGNQIPAITDYTATRTTLEGADAPMSETVIPKKVAAIDADINEVVYYTPNPKYGDVVVNYVNTDGKVIANPVVDTNDALVGTDYSTADQVPEKIVEDATGDVYYYKEIKPEDATKETGTVVEGTTEVTYVYEKAGDVVIKYVDVNGLELQAPVADTTDGKPGSDYNTAEGTEKPATITAKDGKVYALVPAGDYPVGTVAADSNLASGATPTGTVEAGVTKEVTYVYQEVKSDVVVEYYDTEGNPISGTETGNATSVVDTEDASVGTAYNTDDKKPATITAADGTVYYYKEVKDTSAPTTGKVAETTTTVQYVYEKAGDVIVHYITTDGTPISGVTNTGSVTASTVDDTVNGKPGSTYDTSDLRPTTITTDEGKTYELVPTATIGDESGKVESGVTKEVTYVYKEVKGSVVVNYISTTGEELQAQVVDTPESSTGTEYDTTDVKPETITTKDGRTFKLVPKMTQGTEKGEVVPGVTEVTYVYEEVKGDVVVNYVNTDGKVIATQVVDTKTTSTGTAYDTTDNKPEKIVEDATGDVYYYKEVQAGSNETGKVVEGTTEVTYVYEKAGNVVVNYTLADGTVIKNPVKDEENAEPGKTYSTEDNKPETITTEDGKTYKLVPNATIGNETGNVEAGKTTEVTYIYEEVKGSVVVNYIDTEGNVIKAPVTDTPSSSTGTAYDTTDNKPTTITYNGEEYELIPVLTKGSEAGKVVEGETVVTYVYRKVVAPTPDVKTGSVVIRYVEAGNESNVLKDPVLDENAVVTGTKYDTTDEGNKPAEIVKDGVRYVLVPSKTTAVDPNGNPVTETGEVAEGTTVVTYKYQKVANWIPQIPATPENPTPVNPVIPYPFDPENPDKPIDPTTPYPDGGVPSIPHVPGYVPVDPKTNEPLKPVDPTDPSKGYVPPTPDESGKDTPISYVQTGNVVVNYVTEDGTPIKKPVKDETDAPAGKSYDTTDNRPAEIVTEDGSRYVLIPSKTIGSEKGSVEGGKTTEITYVYKKVANWVPQIPATPENPTPVNPVIPYPFDPENPDKPIDPTTPYPDGGVPSIPHVPGYVPVDPKTNEPLRPVDPKDPSKGYVPPTPDESGKDTPIPYVQTGNVVVNYVDENGKVIKDPVQDSTNVPAGKPYDTTDNRPTEITGEDGSRYVLIPSKTIGSETGTVEGGKTTEITYVYKKVANWIPQIPATPENPTPVNPVIPYPFDPENPDKPISPTTPYPDGGVPSIPHVPGYVPVDPKTNEPLKPVDPTDPSKGYVPPTPDESGIDTPIPYVPVTPVTPPVRPTEPGKPVTPPVTPAVPGKPVTPAVPAEPVTPAVPAEPVTPVTPATPATPEAAQLPNTGETSSSAAAILGAGMLVAALALAGKRR
ncbi:YSIRK-type signal peptide-containing protein, partial [Streptococcus suis]|nr:YSIRK-type signal peptide-containing protein [Streptococcus suis]